MTSNGAARHYRDRELPVFASVWCSMTGQQTIPIAQPITGADALGDLSKPVEALAQFYKALNARDLVLMEENWDQSAEAAMDNPLGGIVRGWSGIRQVYQRLFSVSGSYAFEFWDYTLHLDDDVFWAVGRERGQIQSAERKLHLAIRTTRIFRRQGIRWRQIHHHGSIDDPEMLKQYLSAVR